MNNHPFSYFIRWAAGSALLLAVASCSGTKNIGGNAGRKEGGDFVLRKMEAQQIRANWFEAKARISFDDGSQSVKANATVRMQKDSAVWVAVRKLGFEVARVLITTDSIFVIDRLNNEFGVYELSGMAGLYRLPPDLRLLQNLLLGNPVFLSAQSRQFRNEGASLTIEETNQIGLLKYKVHEASYRIQAMEYQDNQRTQQVVMSLEEYSDTPDKQKFSYLRNLTLESQETGKIKVELKFSEVELNVPKSLSFEVPSRYSRIQ